MESEAHLSPAPPKLASPGAGLPKPELLIARLRFWLIQKRLSRQDFVDLFEAESAKVLELARSVSVEDGVRQVLIKRPRGLEDSSRNWSIFMTLQHLRIVNFGVLGIGRALGRGESPEGVVRTADVKPSPSAGAESIEEFEQGCHLLTKAFGKIDDLATSARHPHPWFGPMDAAGWHALSSFHTKLHRVQIDRILAGLKSREPGA